MPAGDKAGVLVGMAMTEKQGGSDLRANTTEARLLGNGTYELVGHKWFCSAPHSMLFDPGAGAGRPELLRPALAPRRHAQPHADPAPQGQARNRSNASAEIEYAGALAWLSRRGGPRRAHHPQDGPPHAPRRRDQFCRADASGACPGAAPREHRTAFQRRLLDQPLMRNVLADLALEVEAATALVMRWRARSIRAVRTGRAQLCPARDRDRQILGVQAGADDDRRGAGVPGRQWLRRESILPRLYREAPVNSIWEGAGNVVAWTCCARSARAGQPGGAARGAEPCARRRPAARWPAGPA